MSNDLTAFLAARLDEDEAEAPTLHDRSADAYLDGDCLCDRPARALREVAAKRDIMQRHRRAGDVLTRAYSPEMCYGCGEEGYLQDPVTPDSGGCPELLAVASVYSEHPDYRQEWTLATAS